MVEPKLEELTHRPDSSEPHRAGRITLIADVDGTVYPFESSWWLYHLVLGTNPRAASNFAQFTSGSVRYDEWANRDARLWKGRSLKDFITVARSIEPRPEFQDLFDEVVAPLQAKLFFVSSGIDVVVREAARRFGANGWFANELKTRHGRLTGGITINVPLGEKGAIVRRLREPGSTIVSIGDSQWDESMFRASDYYIRLRGPRNRLTERGLVLVDFDLGRIRSFFQRQVGGYNASTDPEP